MSKKVLPDLKEKKGTSYAFSEDAVSNALRDLIEALGYSILTMTPADKGAVAEKLSRVAGQDPAWTWRYVHNVLLRKVESSRRFTDAIIKMLAIVQDGANPLMVAVHPVQVFAAHVTPGSIILADSRRCGNPACPIEFVPRTPNQTHCCPACAVAHRKATARAKAEAKAKERAARKRG